MSAISDIMRLDKNSSNLRTRLLACSPRCTGRIRHTDTCFSIPNAMDLARLKPL